MICLLIIQYLPSGGKYGNGDGQGSSTCCVGLWVLVVTDILTILSGCNGCGGGSYTGLKMVIS